MNTPGARGAGEALSDRITIQSGTLDLRVVYNRQLRSLKMRRSSKRAWCPNTGVPMRAPLVTLTMQLDVRESTSTTSQCCLLGDTSCPLVSPLQEKQLVFSVLLHLRSGSRMTSCRVLSSASHPHETPHASDMAAISQDHWRRPDGRLGDEDMESRSDEI